MDLDVAKIFGDACSIASDTFVSSVSDMLWTIIRYLWPWYGLLIIFALGIWIFWEIKTRFGSVHYNSDNGFSPTFNRFVGSGTYLGIQTIVFVALTFFFGNFVYCLKWPIVLHLAIFALSGVFLNLTGFWVYLKEPGRKGKRYRQSRY